MRKLSPSMSTSSTTSSTSSSSVPMHRIGSRPALRRVNSAFSLPRRAGSVGGGGGGATKPDPFSSVSGGLRHCYNKVLRPFEETSNFHQFHSPALDDPDFNAKPMVLLVGQYSTGKTTFIRYLIGEDFPGIRIGPEPTTDKFNVIMHNTEKGIIPGNALAVDPKMQFRPLGKFGNTFLNRLQCSLMDASILQGFSLIDTPGILSGERESLQRGYDFTAVLEWFAARVDRILILFDANKLDISDELRRAIVVLKAHDDKIRIVLNKCDQVDPQQLMRIYGALMWSLGKVMETPEVVRVYIGSFWDQPLVHTGSRELFNQEEHDLLKDLKSLPRHAALRKLNDFIKRARVVKIHLLLMSELAKKMPALFGKERKKRELLDRLEQIYTQIQEEYDVSRGDFPSLAHMRSKLQSADWSQFKIVDKQQLLRLDKLLSEDMSRLMQVVPDSAADSAFKKTLSLGLGLGLGRGGGGGSVGGSVRRRFRAAADALTVTNSVRRAGSSSLLLTQSSDGDGAGDGGGGAGEGVENLLNGPIDAIINARTPFKREDSYEADFFWDLKNKVGGDGWVVPQHHKYITWRRAFKRLSSPGGEGDDEARDKKISGAVAKRELIKSKLPNAILSKIWTLACRGKDGMLDEDEFCLANYLIEWKINGRDLPKELPLFLLPPAPSPQQQHSMSTPPLEEEGVDGDVTGSASALAASVSTLASAKTNGEQGEGERADEKVEEETGAVDKNGEVETGTVDKKEEEEEKEKEKEED